MLHVHLSEAALHDPAHERPGEHAPDRPDEPERRPGRHGVARLERGNRPIPIELVRHWAGNSETTIIIKPVRDLAEHIHVTQYETPDRLKDQTEQINQTCIFPWCTHPATACDKDHTIAHDQGGATCSCNIGPLCRRHHRTKHLTAWTYTRLDTGTYHWRSPHRREYLRDHHGTRDITPTTTSTPTEPGTSTTPHTGGWHQPHAS